jgi:hypothetical protein
LHYTGSQEEQEEADAVIGREVPVVEKSERRRRNRSIFPHTGELLRRTVAMKVVDEKCVHLPHNIPISLCRVVLGQRILGQVVQFRLTPLPDRCISPPAIDDEGGVRRKDVSQPSGE